MSAYICAACGKEEELFPTGHTEKLAAKNGIPFLGKIPFDPRLALASDMGELFMQQHPDTASGKAVTGITAKTIKFFE